MQAQQTAGRLGKPEISSLDVLVALLEQEGGILSPILRKASCDPGLPLQAAQREVSHEPTQSGATTQPQMGRDLATVMQAAEEERKKQEEAEKLKKMSEDDRNAFELKKAKEDLATAQKQINRYKMKQQASEMLGEQGIQLSEAQLDLVVSDDAEATLGRVKSLTSIIADQKEKQRQQMLAGKTPSVAGANKDELKSKIDNIKDPYLRREEMLKHPELYLN